MTPSAPTPPVATALPGLILGAVLIGLAAICVRLADVGPTAVGFWRVALALPVLGLFRVIAAQRERASWEMIDPPPRRIAWLWLAGLAFAIDLALWHRSIHLTSVANATLLSNLSPVVLALTLHFGFGERHGGRFWAGLLLAFSGAAVLVADSLRISSQSVLGDGLAASTALFYAGYQLLVSRQRRLFSAVDVMFWSSAAAAVVLLPLTLLSGETLWPASLHGWAVLIGLALVVHIGGQGLIAWAMAHLPASFSSATLLVQPVAAAGFAWVLLGERFGLQQAIGGLIVLGGILLCRLSLSRG
jgi:drug/metabolite transporter (DMT)-like permease